jgi:hypothetical protein
VSPIAWIAIAGFLLASLRGVVIGRRVWHDETDVLDGLPLREVRSFPFVMAGGFPLMLGGVALAVTSSSQQLLIVYVMLTVAFLVWLPAFCVLWFCVRRWVVRKRWFHHICDRGRAGLGNPVVYRYTACRQTRSAAGGLSRLRLQRRSTHQAGPAGGVLPAVIAASIAACACSSLSHRRAASNPRPATRMR